ncbi:MAG: aspartate--tRNA(Asp/Asn) ligase [Phycisphaerae bacterium]
MAIPYNRRTHKCGELRAAHVGQKVRLAGWVDSYRDHGGMAFIDLRDYTGITQVRFNPEGNAAALELARSLRAEDVIVIEGTVVSRGTNINPRIPTGEIEVIGEALDLLSKAEPPPFEISDRTDASEELRLKHRYLDLRRPVMQRVFRMRHVIAKTIRDYFDANGFVEIETPFLTKSTPEGARDYLVPSRVRQGSFYALPQSPQIFKQLFMVAGFDRYAQIVRCFRDEDLRADRQPEFTQLDMEMSFVQADDVMTMVEGCAKAIFKNALGIDMTTPLPRMTYQEAMDRFGIDRPDTRFGLELQDVTDLVRGVEFAPFKEAAGSGGVIKCIVASGGEALTRKVTDGLTEEIKGIGGVGVPIVKVAAGDAGPTFATGIAKHLEPLAAAICARTGAKPGDTIFFMPGTYDEVCKYLHHVRTRLAEILKLIPENRWDLLWVVDFPLMTYDPDEKRWFSTHHPFTAPMDEDIPLLDTEPNKARSKAYDLVLNGTEMAGGSIRIHQRDVQARVFNLLGISDEEAQLKFSFLLDGLKYGAPPHGGIAFGLDRWVMMLAKMPSLRDVVAFPKTQRAVCLLTGAPTPVAAKQLDELALISKAPPA